MSEPVRQQGEFHNYTDEPSSGGRSPVLIWTLRLVGIAAAVTVWSLLGGSEGLSMDARVVAAVATLMAFWWITEAIPLAMTSLLPIVLFPLLTERSIGETTAPYANPVIFLFLGGFLIAIAMEKWNLHRRVALLTIARVGYKPTRIVLGLMLATGFLSMWVSNTATTLMMLPIGLSVLALVSDRFAAREAEPSSGAGQGQEAAGGAPDANLRRFGVCLTLSIAWAATMGGLGTLLGSPPNAIVAGYAAEELGRSIGFLEWMILGVPLGLTFILLGWLLMTKVLYRFKLDEIPGGRQMIESEIGKLGRLSQGEKMVLAVFGLSAFLWIVPGVLKSIPGLGGRLGLFGELDDAAIAIAAGCALFLLPGRGGREMVLNWKDAEDGLPWGVLLLFGGGLSLAGAVAGTGLDGWLGQQVTGLGALPVVLLVAAVVTLVMFLTEVTSNTATAATFIPVLAGVAVGIGADPMTLLIPAALAATCAFMLPVGTPPNAIVFSSGAVTMKQMARGGLVLNLVGILLIMAFCYLLGGLAFGLRF